MGTEQEKKQMKTGRFLDPKADVVFKKIFGQHPDLIKSFLNNLLPLPEDIDASHRKWREAAITAAKTKDLTGFGHGVAAKLINVYLKGAFVCAGHEGHANVAALHPPIDSLLLDELYENNVGGLKKEWAEARKIRWSKLNSEQYESAISAIRMSMGAEPLWKIESYWRGYQ